MLRVCESGHLTGTKKCYCGAKAGRPLQGRQQPVPGTRNAETLRIRCYRRSGVWPAESMPDLLRGFDGEPVELVIMPVRQRWYRRIARTMYTYTERSRTYLEKEFGVKKPKIK